MAGGASLNDRRGRRLLALLAFVLFVHGAALQWLGSALQPLSRLQALPPPMFTRLLQPQAVVAPPPAQVRAPIRARPARPVVRTVRPPAPVELAASAAEPAASSTVSPEVTPPQTVASAPETTANAPQALTAAPPSAAASATSGSDLDSWPADSRLTYRLGGQFRSGELHGSARVQWQREDNRYQARIEIDVTLLARLVLTSQGEVGAQGLLPRVYEELRRSGPRGARLDDDTVTLANGQRVPRPPGVQDTASQFVELSHRFASGQERLEVGRSVSFWMARPGAVDLWTYDVIGRDLLQTAELGEVEAFHLKPRAIANPRGNITAEMWFAPSLQYLPVRIRVNMGEDTFVDLLVLRIEQR